jgi:acyl carrier protein phosphodiesterase
LAKNWLVYAKIPLQEYTEKVYALIESAGEILPEQIVYMLKYMIPQNWLLNYSRLDGIEKVLKGMARRARFNSQMEYGVEELELNYVEFEEEFTKFFPELQDFVNGKIRDLL